MGLAETCVWIVISIIVFVIFFILGMVTSKGDYEEGFCISLIISCLCLGFCLTYILQMKGVL